MEDTKETCGSVLVADLRTDTGRSAALVGAPDPNRMSDTNVRWNASDRMSEKMSDSLSGYVLIWVI